MSSKWWAVAPASLMLPEPNFAVKRLRPSVEPIMAIRASPAS
jgi:hypothetical protein